MDNARPLRLNALRCVKMSILRTDCRRMLHEDILDKENHPQRRCFKRNVLNITLAMFRRFHRRLCGSTAPAFNGSAVGSTACSRGGT